MFYENPHFHTNQSFGSDLRREQEENIPLTSTIKVEEGLETSLGLGPTVDGLCPGP